MADVQWIKLKVGMFDGDSFKKIKRAKIGGERYRDKLTAIWFELMELAGRCNQGGRFISPRGIPYATIDDIAIQIDRETDELDLCMQFFINEGMVEIINDIYGLTNWCEYQNLEGLDAIREQTRKRVAKHREKQKLLAFNGNTTCQYCGGEATGFDHIIALSKGGEDTDSNKVPCCIECNRIKNDKPLVDFLNNNRSRIKDEIVTANEKLSRFVSLCNVTNRYNVTLPSYIEKEEDKEKELLTISLAREKNEAVENLVDNEDNDSDEKDRQRNFMYGDLGEGLVFMSNDQWAYICEHYSLDEIHYYFEVIKEQIRMGRRYRKTHFQAFVDMAEKDRKKK